VLAPKYIELEGEVGRKWRRRKERSKGGDGERGNQKGREWKGKRRSKRE
jgi:hypothetical protein